MANYKNIVDVEMLAEAGESTNVLVEEGGSLKKIPSSAIGGKSTGGNAGVFVIHPSPGMPDCLLIGYAEEGETEPVSNEMVMQAMRNGIVYYSTDNSLSMVNYASYGEYMTYVDDSGPARKIFYISD